MIVTLLLFVCLQLRFVCCRRHVLHVVYRRVSAGGRASGAGRQHRRLERCGVSLQLVLRRPGGLKTVRGGEHKNIGDTTLIVTRYVPSVSASNPERLSLLLQKPGSCGPSKCARMLATMWLHGPKQGP